MKPVLIHILRRKHGYAKLPFFDFLRDESIAPRDRLAFVPAMANFIMSFGDFNRHVLRDDANGHDPHQRMLNDHAREDDHHWPWFLEDFAKLGFDVFSGEGTRIYRTYDLEAAGMDMRQPGPYESVYELPADALTSFNFSLSKPMP